MYAVSQNEKLMNQWNYEKNVGLDPATLSSTSKERVWWICHKCGHEWEAIIRKRNDSTGLCPKCDRPNSAPKKIIADIPHVMKYWGDNPNLDPKTITSGSREKANFKCPDCGYVWQRTIREMYKHPSDCPACEKNTRPFPPSIIEKIYRFYDYDFTDNPKLEDLPQKSDTIVHWKCRVCGLKWETPVGERVRINGKEYVINGCPNCSARKKDSFAGRNPILAEMYSPNNPVPFEKLTKPDRMRNQLWICPECGAEFQRSLNYMIKNQDTELKGCPECFNRKGQISAESFADVHPELLSEFDEDNTISPYVVGPKSHKVAKWKCSNGHQYEATFLARHLGGSCPDCKKASSLHGMFVDIAKQWSPSNDTTPDNVAPDATTRRLWICDECGLEFQATIADMTSGKASCPRCGDAPRLAHFPELLKYWDYERNTSDINRVRIDSTLDYSLKCPQGHRFELSFAEVADYINQGKDPCPFCDGRRIAPEDSLSEQYPELMQYWHEDYVPNQISPTSNYYYEWKCSKDHLYIETPFLMVERFKANHELCPYCDNRKALAGFNSLADTHPELTTYWSESNERNFSEFLESSGYTAKWVCPNCGGEYLKAINDFVAKPNDCPYCDNRLVLPGFNSLQAKYPHLMEEWDWVSNSVLVNPDKVFPTSVETAWWECPNNHHYRMIIKSRVMFDRRGMTACPICKGLNRKKSHVHRYQKG